MDRRTEKYKVEDIPDLKDPLRRKTLQKLYEKESALDDLMHVAHGQHLTSVSMFKFADNHVQARFDSFHCYS